MNRRLREDEEFDSTEELVDDVGVDLDSDDDGDEELVDDVGIDDSDEGCEEAWDDVETLGEEFDFIAGELESEDDPVCQAMGAITDDLGDLYDSIEELADEACDGEEGMNDDYEDDFDDDDDYEDDYEDEEVDEDEDFDEDEDDEDYEDEESDDSDDEEDDEDYEDDEDFDE